MVQSNDPVLHSDRNTPQESASECCSVKLFIKKAVICTFDVLNHLQCGSPLRPWQRLQFNVKFYFSFSFW